VASGGVTNPLEAVKALALGADVVGLARPVLQALLNEGEEGAEAFLSALIEGIKRVFMLTGAQNIQSLREKPVVLGPQLEAWRRAV
jgi:isopentenyl-diphosphate delta-isomerase